MTKEQEVKEITDALYKAYGSDTGHLFGLASSQRAIVEAIVKFTLEFNKGGVGQDTEEEEDCPICHGAGATMDHHDPCTECGGSGKVGGEG